MTLNPNFSQITWFPPQVGRTTANGKQLGTAVLGRSRFKIRESKEFPGLFTGGCRKQSRCVRIAANEPRNQFRFRWAQGDKPWEKNFMVEGAMPEPCCDDLPSQAKKYGLKAPEVIKCCEWYSISTS